MILTLLPIILLYFVACVLASKISVEQEEGIHQFPDWLVRIFSPEGAKMLDELQMPHPTPIRMNHLGTFQNRPALHKHLNSLDLGETEDEDEAEELIRTNSVDEYRGDLTEELFFAAVELGNIERLNDLLYKKKHLLLTAEQKAKVLKISMLSCFHDAAVFGEIFKILLNANFYPKDGVWPRINNHPLDDTEYPLDCVLKKPQLYQPFLAYDEDIFVKHSGAERHFPAYFLIEFVKNCEYALVKSALSLGLDPKIVEIAGRNVLDFALDTARCTHQHQDQDQKQEQEQERHGLIKMLQEQYGMKPSNTIENLRYLCWIENDCERAINLVKLGGMSIQTISPIAVAFSFKNVDLVNAVLDTYLDKLSVSQLKFDMAQYDPSFERDEKQRKLLDEAADKVRNAILNRGNEYI